MTTDLSHVFDSQVGNDVEQLRARSDSAHETHETDVDMDAFFRLANVAKRHAWIRMCIDALMRITLRHRPNFLRGPQREPAEVSRAVQEVYDMYWKPFLYDFTFTALTLGVVPIKFVPLVDAANPAADRTTARKRRRDDTVMVPVVPKLDFKLRQAYDTRAHRFVYRLFERHRRTTSGGGGAFGLTEEHQWVEVKDAMVVSNIGYDPAEDGTLRSVVASIMSSVEFMDRLDTYMIDAQSQRSNPAIYLQTPDSSSSSASTETSPLSFSNPLYDPRYATAATLKQVVQNEMAVDETRQRYRQMASRREQGVSRRMIIDACVTASTAANSAPMLPLPPGMTVARQELPETIQDFTEVRRAFQMTICSAFGISMSFLMPIEGRSVAGNIGGEWEMVGQTIGRWHDLFGDVLTAIYRRVFGDADTADLITRLKQQGLWARMNSKQARDVALNNVVHVVFPSAPFENLETLHRLFETGVIEHSGYRELASMRMNIPRELTATKDLPRAQEQQAAATAAKQQNTATTAKEEHVKKKARKKKDIDA